MHRDAECGLTWESASKPLHCEDCQMLSVLVPPKDWQSGRLAVRK